MLAMRSELPVTADAQIAHLARMRLLAGASRAVGNPLNSLRTPIELAKPTIMVNGIGRARSKALNQIGITNVRQLARTAPSVLIERLRFPKPVATAVVAEARKLLSEG